MAADLPPRTSLDSLRKEAKQWLKALRAHDPGARARFLRLHPVPPDIPGLRDVQHALARELGFPSWPRLKARLTELARERARPAQSPLTTFLDAAGRGDAARVGDLLDEHPLMINERGELPGSTGKRTALHFGVEHVPVVKLLLERGADPNIRDDGDNAMPLHFAAEKQDIDVIRLLVEHGADTVGEGTMHELDVLGWATAWDYVTANPDVVDYLLAHAARYTMASAVALGAVDAIRDIAARSRNEVDRPMDAANHRRRPLHLAVVKKQRASLTVLLEFGADTEARDRARLTPLDQAALAGEVELAQILIDHGATIDLPAAVALGRTADVERLLAADRGCLAPGGRWGALIVRAAEHAPTHVIETLLRLGASPNAADDPATAVDGAIGLTPLHAAAIRGRIDAVRMLLARGANPRLREQKYEATAVGWAAHGGHEAVRDLILEGPIDIFDAIAFDRSQRVQQILDEDPVALDRTLGETAGVKGEESWCTPLVWAVGHNKPDSVRLLLSRGAKVVDAPDGMTLLQSATEHGHEEIAGMLRGHSSSGPAEASVWREAERALLTGEAALLERFLKQHAELFRTGRPPASTPGGLAPDYSAMDAREVIIRNHQFESWEAYGAFRADGNVALSPITSFEAAADAIVKGDIASLEWLLRSNPELIRARSRRMHHAMLIHYVGPNGIEYFRQATPPNAPAIAQLLIASGADVNATADIYGGGATVLGLAATSITPVVAGVVTPLLEALLDGGTTIQPDGGALVNSCLRNGRSEAAAFLVSRGAEVDLEAAAGIGRLDFVKACFDENGSLKPPSTRQQMADGFTWACEFGHADVVRFLIENGMDVAAKLKHHGQTGLHWAAGGGHVETVDVLLSHTAPVDAIDDEWKATPIQWAVYGRFHNTAAGIAVERYHAVIRRLVAAGATVKPEWLQDEAASDDPDIQAALSGR
jgi:ankyrin repeat protein